MPLEDLVGSNKFINSLNASWPLGSDFPDAGDDHLRGTKNVLKNSFPNVTGPVTLTETQINQGSVPAGSVLAFYQAAAPAGWERVTGFINTFGIRIVGSADAGGVSGGTDDPVLMDKVPSHTHNFAAKSGNTSNDHTHSFNVNSGGQNVNHSHVVSDPGHAHLQQGVSYGKDSGGGYGTYIAYGNSGVPTLAAVTGISIGAENTAHAHNVSGGTGVASANHTHAVSGATGANGSAANWQPRYLDMILCRRM